MRQISVQIMKQQFLNAIAASVGFGNTALTVTKVPRNAELEFTAQSKSSGIVHHAHAHGDHGGCSGGDGDHGHAHGGDVGGHGSCDDAHHDHAHGRSDTHLDDHHGHSHGGGGECVTAPAGVVALPPKESVWGTAQKRVRVLDPKAQAGSGSVGDSPTRPTFHGSGGPFVQSSTPLRPGSVIDGHRDEEGAPKDS